jgi:hypothetical protein
MAKRNARRRNRKSGLIHTLKMIGVALLSMLLGALTALIWSFA